MSNHYLQKMPRITTVILDIDGVLTDGMVTLLPNGEQVRNLNSKDSFAIQLAVKKGIRICVISGGNSENIKLRLNQMGVSDVFLRIKNKLQTFEDICTMYDLQPEKVMYMGDDLPDYEVMTQVGIATCPSDAAIEILDLASYISDHKGGQGAVRDILEKLLRAKGEWMKSKSDFQW